MLHSVPTDRSSALYRLLDGGARELGAVPSEAVRYSPGSRYTPPSIKVSLPRATAGEASSLLEELRQPFGRVPGVTKLAKAIFRGVALGSPVEVCFNGGVFSLSGENMEVPEDLTDPQGDGLILEFGTPSSLPDHREHEKSFARHLHTYLVGCEKLLPLESFSREVSGFFAYRTSHFAAIRSYARAPHADSNLLNLDLWKGPYEFPQLSTAILQARRPGKFLFLTWRPNYGNPTFIHHRLDSALGFGPQTYHATFWVHTTDRGAHVQFFSGGVVSDPVPVEGPVGLTGMVVWPGLTYDLWGTQLVRDSHFESALRWAQMQVTATAGCLRENLTTVIDRLLGSSNLKRSYIEETVQRIKTYWG